MYHVKLHERVNQAIELFYRIGLWNHGDDLNFRDIGIKLFYSIFHSLFSVSIMAGAYGNENTGESITLVQSSILTAVLAAKLGHIIWKQKEIVELLHQICIYSIPDHDDFTLVNDKLKNLMNFATLFVIFTDFPGVCAMLIVPFLGSERRLFVNIGFPFDWRNNEVAFWLAFVFFLAEGILSFISELFSILLWYLLINSALRSTNRLQSFASDIFFIQIWTSGFGICGAIYCLTVAASDNYLENLIYVALIVHNFFDIFMVMYYGNEIKNSSDRLSYCLFESNWMDQPEMSKKRIIIFGEFLMRPQELIIGKIYSVTLGTFTTILKGAWSMFNILKRLK